MGVGGEGQVGGEVGKKDGGKRMRGVSTGDWRADWMERMRGEGKTRTRIRRHISQLQMHVWLSLA
jgi:hypothetical protein